MRRELADVLETVKRAKDRGKACTLLIGAGCSVKAGIPTADEFVEIIREKYQRAYARAPKKTYPHVMAQLSVAERHDLISEYINNAKLNWAHLAIAQLLKAGYVDRVLTVNFDPLVMRACALVGMFPAVYDFAASQHFKPDFIARQSVFYLHGQHTGFVVLNTESEVEQLSKHLGPVFSDSVQGRVWIVAGYSGENDPVFDHLAKIERYDNGLYWICYKEAPPQQHVQDRLLVNGKDCYFIQGFDADDFFVVLAQNLGCFPPDFVQTPFTHLENLLEPVLPYSLPGNESSLEAIPKKLLRSAIEKIEKPAELALRARDLLFTGDYDSVIAMEPEFAKTPTSELADLIAWAYVSVGNELMAEAQNNYGEESDKLWALVGEKYEAALRIQPDKHEALYNWANALKRQARSKSGEEADRLWALAWEKYEAALQIKPDYHEALNNWATGLVTQAQTKSGEEADRLWTLAWEKYEAALKIKPDKHGALYNWGTALGSQAETKSGEEADRLWALAGEKYEAALKLKPDYDKALYNWGTALGSQAGTKSGEEADRLLALAGEKYEAALKLKPDYHQALNNWGSVLDDQARTRSGEEADWLWALAGKKYEAALKIKPDKHEALNNWGIAFAAQAKTKSGEEADRLWALAGEKYEAALKINPDYHEALYNWSLALMSQAETKSGEEAGRLLQLANEKLSAARALAPELYPTEDEMTETKLARADSEE
jgi:cytochrome c-type biogenesis protein CcmH/NrfG